LLDLGGHSISKRLLLIASRSISPSTAQACTTLPLFCLTGCSFTKIPLHLFFERMARQDEPEKPAVAYLSSGIKVFLRFASA
jgi:hypothetical protein